MNKTFGVVLALCLIAGAACPAMSVETLALKQNSEEWGPLEVILCDQGIRMDTTEFTVLIQPPDWHVTILNLSVKKYIEMKPEEFSKLRTVEQLKHDGIKVVKGKTEPIAGVLCSHYVTTQKQAKYSYDLWATEKLGTDAKLNDSCLTFLAIGEIPKGVGLPLRLERRTGKRQYVYLTTTEVKHQKVDKVDFHRPRYLVKAESLIELLGDIKGHEDLVPEGKHQ